MARIIAIDYGRKRVGLAVTDPLGIIANGLDTVTNVELLDFLKDYFLKEEVDRIVIGQPRQMNNEYSEIEVEILQFIERLKKKFPEKTVERVDERFTSKMAKQTMIDGGLKKSARRNKSLIDKISATIILQGYLQQKEFNRQDD